MQKKERLTANAPNHIAHVRHLIEVFLILKVPMPSPNVMKVEETICNFNGAI
jgi:hypothetical protein